MTDEEIEAVAEELAKAGGTSWYPGRTLGVLLRPVSERYRDRARLAIAALDRVRAANGAAVTPDKPGIGAPHRAPSTNRPDEFHVGATVVYRPPGDQRAITCRIEQVEAGRAYLVPAPRQDIGWVSLESLMPLAADDRTKDL